MLDPSLYTSSFYTTNLAMFGVGPVELIILGGIVVFGIGALVFMLNRGD